MLSCKLLPTPKDGLYNIYFWGIVITQITHGIQGLNSRVPLPALYGLTNHQSLVVICTYVQMYID